MWLINCLWRHWGLKWTLTHMSTESMEMTGVCRLPFNQKRILQLAYCGLRLKCDGKRAEPRFCLSAKRTSPFKSAGASVQLTTGSRGVCASAIVMLDTPCSEVVWRVLATHSIRLFPLHFPSRASPCVITFQLDSTNLLNFESLTSLSTMGSGEYEFNVN